MPKTTRGLIRIEWGCADCSEQNSDFFDPSAVRTTQRMVSFKCDECSNVVAVTQIRTRSESVDEKDAIKVEVGDTVLLGSQRIRAVVVAEPGFPGFYLGVRLDGIDYKSDARSVVPRDAVVEVIKPPRPMPEFQEGDMVRFRGSDALYRVIDLQAQYNDVREIWRLTAPDTLTKIWERKP